MKSAVISNLSVTRGDDKGEINLSWDSVESAELYVIQFSDSTIGLRLNRAKNAASTSNNTSWKTADIINESKYTIRGLKERKTYSFRVAAVTSSNQGPWSRTVKKDI